MSARKAKMITNCGEMKSEYDSSTGVRARFYRPKTRVTTHGLDDELILYFTKKARKKKVAYQTLTSAALREYVQEHADD